MYQNEMAASGSRLLAIQMGNSCGDRGGVLGNLNSKCCTVLPWQHAGREHCSPVGLVVHPLDDCVSQNEVVHEGYNHPGNCNEIIWLNSTNPFTVPLVRSIFRLESAGPVLLAEQIVDKSEQANL